MRILAQRRVYEGKILQLDVERVELPSGATTELEILRHPGAAAVVPLTEDGEVILVRQYRHATSGWLLEVPAGKLDAGESPEHCARREVEEETGFRPGRLEPLGWIWTSPGFTDEKIWLFLATELEPAEQHLEEDELLSIERLPLETAVAMATSGEITDGKTVSALLRLKFRL